MKKNQVSKTVMHKCVFSNQVHELLEPELDKKASERTPNWRKKQLTEKEKAELFDKIAALHKECSRNITAHKYNKRQAKRTHQHRLETGWYEKRTSRKQKLEEVK